MAVFTFSEETIGRIARRGRRLRMRVRAIAVTWLVVDLAVAVGQFYWPQIRIDLSPRWVDFAFIFPFVLLTTSFNGQKRTMERVKAYLLSYSVDVSPYSVRIQSDLRPQRQFRRDEILRVEEPSWGGALYLRTYSRYRYLQIPQNLDGYGQIKDELRAMGIPFTKKVFPANWEGFAFAFLFCGTLICDLVTQNRQILAANLILAIFLGIGGFLIISANPDSSPRMRWARFGAFLPAAISAFTFFL